MMKRKDQQLAEKAKILKGVQHYQDTGLGDLFDMKNQLANLSMLLQEESGEEDNIDALWKAIQSKVNEQSIKSMKPVGEGMPIKTGSTIKPPVPAFPDLDKPGVAEFPIFTPGRATSEPGAEPTPRDGGAEKNSFTAPQGKGESGGIGEPEIDYVKLVQNNAISKKDFYAKAIEIISSVRRHAAH